MTTAARNGTRWFRRVLLVEVAVSVGAGVAYALTVGRHLTLGLDSVSYLLVGDFVSTGSGYSNPAALLTTGIRRPTANFPPGFPLFVAGLHDLGITTPTGIRVAAAVLGGLTVLATGLVARRITGSSTVGVIGAGVVAVLPTVLAVDGSVMSETLVVPLTALLLLAISWALDAPSARRWLVAGLLAGTLALVRSDEVAVAVVLVPLSALLAAPARARRRLLHAAVALAAVAVVVAPWVVRNEVDFRPPVTFSTNGGKTLAGANCPATYHGPLVGYWTDACAGPDALQVADEGRYNQVVLARGADYVRDHLGRAPVVAGVRVLRAWGLYAPLQTARLGQFESRSVGWQQLAWISFLVLTALALPGIWLLRRDRRALLLVAVPLALNTAVVAVSVGNPRLLVSSVPSLCIAAAVALRAGWHAAQQRHAVRQPRRPGPAANLRA